MERITAILKRYAISRVKALQAVHRCDLGRLQAAKRIQDVADYFSSKPQDVQIRAIRQIEPEILMLLPAEGSRYKKQREQMLSLIQQATKTPTI